MQTVRQKSQARKLMEGEAVLSHGVVKVSLDEVLARLRRFLVDSLTGRWSVSFEVCQEWEQLLKNSSAILKYATFDPDHEPEYWNEQHILIGTLENLTTYFSEIHRSCRVTCHQGHLCVTHNATLFQYLGTLDFAGR